MHHILTCSALITTAAFTSISWRWISTTERFVLVIQYPSFFAELSSYLVASEQPNWILNSICLILTQSAAFYPYYKFYMLRKNHMLA
jgi:hypothetical protein